MKNRVITSIVYVLVWLALCALKWLVPGGWGSLGFDAVFCAVSVLGCLEFLRATGAKEGCAVSYVQKAITVSYCAVVVPLYVVVQLVMGNGFLAVVFCTAIYAFILAALNVFNHGASTIRATAICLLAIIYCGLLSCVLSAVNHLAYNSVVAIIAMFLIVMFTDGGAFIVGSLLGRFVPLKLAPGVSPNKTVIGGVGGLIGGMAGAVIAYYVYIALGGVFVYDGNVHPAVVFLIVGLIVSVLTQIGDLFESSIKRECGIKDMGKLLPGHGGVLDRFDGMLFSGVVVLVCFALIIV